MRVLMTDLFLPNSLYTVELGRALSAYVELTIFCKKKAARKEERNIQWVDGFYEDGKPLLMAIPAYFAGLCRLMRTIQQGHYDVVHVQTFKYAKVEMSVYRVMKKRCKMLVYTVHNLLPHEAGSGDRKRYGGFYHLCDLLVVHNQYCKSLLMETYAVPEERICVMPHGAYSEIVPKKITKKRQKITFLQFGVFRQYKGIDILLEAIALLTPDERAHVQVIIVGARFEKLDNRDYEGMAKRLGIEDVVTIKVGHIPDEELEALFEKADICLFPYRNIYGSGALLMAYSFQKPVIASDIEAFKEETNDGETGLLFERGNPEALKQGIMQAVAWTEADYEKREKAIAHLVEEKYNWTVSAKILSEAYRKIWKKKNTPSF